MYSYLNEFSVEVPGCEAYREYMFTFLRAHPLWCRIEFWQEAFVESLRQLQKNKLKALKDTAETNCPEEAPLNKTSPEVGDNNAFKQLA